MLVTSDLDAEGRAMAGMSVEPYREITFDKDGDGDSAQRDTLGRLGVTDLVVFAHGWNSSRSVATRLYDRFFGPFPGLLPAGARVGYAGVVWPSMMFTDEPVPDFARVAGSARVAAAPTEPGLDAESRDALVALFPEQTWVIQRLARLLDERPEDETAIREFGALLRELTGAEGAGATAGDDEATPAFLFGDPVEVCATFADALESLEAAPPPQEPEGPGGRQELLGSRLKRLWKGAKEALRQATYYTMKRRAGKVGERGLGPLLGELARSSPALRIHLVGHSMGARLVAFALRGLPGGTRNVKSVTLLQGAFSHYAFAASLPHDRGSAGALRDMQRRVDGPVVACHSRHDTALGVIYPLASRLARDSSSMAGLDRRWWAVGHSGVQGVPGTPSLTLDEALRAGVAASGCVNVDAASVVRRGGPPSGAHSDICHPELARVVIAAGRIGGG
ncbi:serine-threonine protein kinase [Streptomyces purpureus]|uniref:serine-threonine protein kinase n=1 Tax=Streptomyces purpureus TaxID=1951 RepID=UPI00378DCFDD